MNNSKLVYGAGLIALSLAVFFIGSKTKNKWHPNFKDTHWGGPNNKAVDSFSIAGINQLKANGSCDIELIASDRNLVVFYYNKEEMNNESSLIDSILNVEFDNDGGNLFSRKSDGIKVKIYTRNINNIMQEGVGSISSNDTLIQDKIRLSNEGVGSMEFAVQTNKIELINGGVGSIDISGVAETAEILNEGTGSIDAEKLKLKTARINNQGVGSISVNASETLDMTNQGIGSIDYKGDAKVLHSQSQGLGSINKN